MGADPAQRHSRCGAAVSEEHVPAGLEALFMEHRPQLLRFLRARGAGDAAEDVLQDLWLKLRTQPDGPIASPLAYLHRMANNLLLDRRRAEQRARGRDEAWSEGATDGGAIPSGEAAAAAQDELRSVDGVLAALGERTSHIFRRYRLDGASQRDIAAELGISLSSVEKHLQKAYRALVDLRRRLDAE